MPAPETRNSMGQAWTMLVDGFSPGAHAVAGG
jgi:hypothetical protein